MTGGRRRGEVAGVVYPPAWGEAAEQQAFRRWLAGLSPEQRTPRAVYAYMEARLLAIHQAWEAYQALTRQEAQREQLWARDRIRTLTEVLDEREAELRRLRG